MNTIVSLKYLCRFCGNFNQNNRNLFPEPNEGSQENDHKMFVNKICLVFYTLVLEGDHFPKYICRKCEDFVNLSYEKRKIFEQCQKHWIATTTTTTTTAATSTSTTDESLKDEKIDFLDKLQQIKEGTAQIEKILDSHLTNFEKVTDRSHRLNNHAKDIITNGPKEPSKSSGDNMLRKLLTENLVYNAHTLKRLCINYFNESGHTLLDTYLKVVLPPMSTDDEDDDDDDEDDNVPLIKTVTKERQKQIFQPTLVNKTVKKRKHDRNFIRNISKKRRRKERINYAEDYPDDLLFRSFDSSKSTPSPVTVLPAAETTKDVGPSAASHRVVENKVSEMFKINPASIIQINSAVSIALKNSGTVSPASANRSTSISSNSSNDVGSEKVILNGCSAGSTSSSSIKLKINIPEQRIVPNQQTSGDSEIAKQKCKKCGVMVANLKELAVHQANHLKVRLRNLNTRKLLRPALRRGKCITVQNQRYLRCMNCLKTYGNVNSLKLHWVNRRCNFYCKICGRSFSENPLVLAKHILTQHGITQDLNRNMTVTKTFSEPSSTGVVTVTKVLAQPRPGGSNVNLKSMEQLTNNLRSPTIPGVRIVKREVTATTESSPMNVAADDSKRAILSKYIVTPRINKMATIRPRAPGMVPPNGVARIGNLTIRPAWVKRSSGPIEVRPMPIGTKLTCPVCFATFQTNQQRLEHMKHHRMTAKIGGETSGQIFVNSPTMGGGRMLNSQKLKILAQNQQQRIDQQKKLQQSLQRIKQIKLNKPASQSPPSQSPQQGQPRLQPISTSLLLKQQLQQKQQQNVYPIVNHTMTVVPPLAMLQSPTQMSPQQSGSLAGPNMPFGGRRMVSQPPYFNGPPQPQHSPQPPALGGYSTPPVVPPSLDSCQLCGLQFYNKAEFFAHKQQCTDQSQQQTCPYCYKLFLTASDLQMHIMCIHPEVEN